MDDDEVVRLRIALARTARWLNRQSTGCGYSTAQLSVLGTVSRLGPIGVGALAEAEGINPTMLSRVIGKLDEAGLVERSTAPDDRRAARVAVTARGRELHLRVRAERTRLLADRVGGLSTSHREQLLASLSAIEALAGPGEVGR